MNRLIFSILFVIIFSLDFPKINGKGILLQHTVIIKHLKEISTANSEVELYNMGSSDYGYQFMFVLSMGQKIPPIHLKKLEKKLLFYLTMLFIQENQMVLMLV